MTRQPVTLQLSEAIWQQAQTAAILHQHFFKHLTPTQAEFEAALDLTGFCNP